ncbi:MAG: DUF4249 domain-containing protein [Reichenbachiella sp.]
MKSLLIVLATSFLFLGCDEQIFPTLEKKTPLVVIDAFISNSSQSQIIVVSMSQPYLDETRILGVSDALVNVIYGTDNTQVTFTHQENGVYTSPAGFGAVGDDFLLNVTVDGILYESASEMKRVPKVDSVTFKFDSFDAFGIQEEFFLGEFWATDIEGAGDTYWIKAFKNGEFLNQPSEINLAYDASFSAGSSADNSVFIQPIREGVNRFEDDPDEFISPYVDGDSLYVELHSITNEAFNFMNLMFQNTAVEGGFAALFSPPLSNTPGNIISNDPANTLEVLGFFSVSAVEVNWNVLVEADIPITE